jgi:hypothetical protein
MYGSTYISTSVSQYSAIQLRLKAVVGVFVSSSTSLDPDEMPIAYEVAHSHLCLVHLFRPNGLGTSAKASGKGYAAPVQGEDFYTADEAARILRLTTSSIRQMLRAGELEGIPPEESGGP